MIPNNVLQFGCKLSTKTNMWKPGWKFVSFIVIIFAWRWFTKRPSTSETFRGKNVVICGGSTGIGEQMAYRFCEQGANVLVVARREWALKNVVQNCTRLGSASASYLIADLQGGSEGPKKLLTVSTLCQIHPCSRGFIHEAFEVQ